MHARRAFPGALRELKAKVEGEGVPAGDAGNRLALSLEELLGSLLAEAESVRGDLGASTLKVGECIERQDLGGGDGSDLAFVLWPPWRGAQGLVVVMLACVGLAAAACMWLVGGWKADGTAQRWAHASSASIGMSSPTTSRAGGGSLPSSRSIRSRHHGR